MHKLAKYILTEFFPTFFTLFFIIGLIVSLIFIISISNITAGLQITFIELVKLYLLSLPQIIFIAIPLAFFISAASVYARLSETQELVAMFSLGFKPMKVLAPVIVLAVLVSLINLFILFVSIPYSKVAFTNLKNQKKQEAKFNFQSSQISQQFGTWSIFAQQSKNKSYSNLYLYDSKSKRFIIADSANLKNSKGYLQFILNSGNIYDFNKTFYINFDKMVINQKIPKIKISIFNFKNYFTYNKKLFTKYLPFALIPLALLFFIPLISFFHPRLHKNRTLAYSILILAIYIVITFANKNFYVSIAIPFVFFITGWVLYRWKVKF